MGLGEMMLKNNQVKIWMKKAKIEKGKYKRNKYKRNVLDVHRKEAGSDTLDKNARD